MHVKHLHRSRLCRAIVHHAMVYRRVTRAETLQLYGSRAGKLLGTLVSAGALVRFAPGIYTPGASARAVVGQGAPPSMRHSPAAFASCLSSNSAELSIYTISPCTPSAPDPYSNHVTRS